VRIAFASDHAGFPHKDVLAQMCRDLGHEVVDFGPDSGNDSVDYPDYAFPVAQAVANGDVDRGVLVCGTGIGMAIAANKVPGVRAANILRPDFAELAREHNNANVITLSGRFVDLETNKQILETFLSTEFAGGRHQNRLDKVTAQESRERN